MASSSTHLSANLSETLRKIRAWKNYSHFSNVSMEDNNSDNESQIEPLFNSSPMASRRQLANRQVCT